MLLDIRPSGERRIRTIFYPPYTPVLNMDNIICSNKKTQYPAIYGDINVSNGDIEQLVTIVFLRKSVYQMAKGLCS